MKGSKCTGITSIKASEMFVWSVVMGCSQALCYLEVLEAGTFSIDVELDLALWSVKARVAGADGRDALGSLAAFLFPIHNLHRLLTPSLLDFQHPIVTAKMFLNVKGRFGF